MAVTIFSTKIVQKLFEQIVEDLYEKLCLPMVINYEISLLLFFR